MSVSNTSIVRLQRQLYSTICHIKVLSRAFDTVWNGEVDEEEANGFTEGFSDVVDTLKNITRELDAFKEPVEMNARAKVTSLHR